ncbi:chemotaxis protein CheB [Caballeronia sp. LjRoot31]|uniref:chemotaxis protein CheB n=1 Tax=Caballeronia sp. LjRoot31 TaxID=3342324 RepID=UPI003ECD906A
MLNISRHQPRTGQSRSRGGLALSAGHLHSASAAFQVVAIGASAGGLEACRKLMDALPAGTGMAFILVQHLDPTHESMLVELIAGRTSMTVVQAVDGMSLEREHLYIIPPGAYLSVANGALHLSQPQERHGARLPFDFLLHSLAEEEGPRSIGVVLSGTGADGSIGLKMLKDKGGYVIAQDPDEAEYDGMPRSAIATGIVDRVLPVAAIAEALIKYDRSITLTPTPTQNDSVALITRQHLDGVPHALERVIQLLCTKTAHDFTLYKPGTLKRRIERRMAMAGVANGDIDRYLEILGNDAGELKLLAKDLLINVTHFFRDPKVYDFLAQKIIPDLVSSHTGDRPIRIWVAGCSTGEEAYSIAMLFIEEIAVSKRNIKVQLLASDVDPDAVTTAREGVYPETIQADVSPARLARFFSLEDHHYRVLPELRAAIVFTVQNVLADPPFSRLDLVSCRNLLIYLLPEAQEKVVSLFHFALREGGVLLLGNAETISHAEGRFELISKQERLYRHIGRSGPGDLNFSMPAGGGMRVPAGPGQGQEPARQSALAELCRRLVIERYAPAAVLVNHQHECLYSLGATDRYLSVAPGQPTHDLFAMARPGVRTKLRSAIQQASQGNVRTVINGGRVTYDGRPLAFSIEVQPVMTEGEALLLVCFIDQQQVELKHKESAHPTEPQNEAKATELEQELEATRAQLQSAIRNLEISSEEQKAINEEALSANEEYQSTNEELLTSKEELQSLNEELTALNGQLQETLERQRTTSNDLQNVLYSTDVATLFLDTELKIRFFTPATRSLFSVIPGDIGRPLADLNSLATDGALPIDVQTVLRSLVPVEREIETRGDMWFTRRILPYRTEDGGVGGVVITFTDITERKRTAKALELARKQAELANIAKSRFLAAASHDLRQPLQTLALLQGLLVKTVEGDKGQDLLTRLDETISAMSEMLNTLLDINQIEAGTVHADMVSFPVNELLHRLKNEFSFQAQAKGIVLHVATCSLTLYSDPRLLEQVIRNLLSNALKYTPHGKVLLGCRRRHGTLSIEVWDTGVGIAKDELQAIFQEYHQLDNPARERSRGLGLGLSIVQRLADLLGHRLRVRSQLGKGSAFAIEVDLPPPGTPPQSQRTPSYATDQEAIRSARRPGMILVIEDDPEVREALELALNEEGHHAVGVPDGVAALEWLAHGSVLPDLVLADYNLPNGMNGVQAVVKMRDKLRSELPVIILTGDISTETLRDIAFHHCEQVVKPVKFEELTHVIQRLLATSQAATPMPAAQPVETAGDKDSPVIFVVDDDAQVRGAIRSVLEDAGRSVEDFASAEAFLEGWHPGRESCLLLDASLPGMSGLELLQRLHDAGHWLPVIMITGHSDVQTVVQAMKAGALDFIEKPIGRSELLQSIDRAFEKSVDSNKSIAWRQSAADHMADLTARQREIMDRVLAGQPSKVIATALGISQRTVENHRAAIMKKTGCKSLPALARLALAAAWGHTDGQLGQGGPAASALARP